MLCLTSLVGRNRREEQAADQHESTSAKMCFLLAFIWFGAQGSRGGFAAFFYWGDARKWHLSHQSLVTPTIRGKESSHMRGMRSFGSVPTCSGWGGSHIGRFSPLRMTIRGAGSLTGWRLRRLFYWGDVRKWYSSHGLPVITTIRVGPWRRKSRRGTSEFGLIQRGA